MADFSLETIENAVGTMTLDAQGSILEATGELEGRQDQADICLQLLQNSKSALKHDGKGFKRLCVSSTSGGSSYIIAMVGGKVCVVKKAN